MAKSRLVGPGIYGRYRPSTQEVVIKLKLEDLNEHPSERGNYSLGLAQYANLGILDEKLSGLIFNANCFLDVRYTSRESFVEAVDGGKG